jgi:hypothetical protein
LAVKDEYTFAFLDLDDAYSERELERALTERIGVIHLVNEDVPKPAKLPATADVELPLLLALALLQNGDVVGLANFSHKPCEFYISSVHLVRYSFAIG